MANVIEDISGHGQPQGRRRPEAAAAFSSFINGGRRRALTLSPLAHTGRSRKGPVILGPGAPHGRLSCCRGVTHARVDPCPESFRGDRDVHGRVVEIEMKCKLAVMDSSGDKETTWDPANPSEVAAAKAIFDAVKKRGYLLYSQPAGESGVAVRQFDPNVETLIAVPPLVAG